MLKSTYNGTWQQYGSTYYGTGPTLHVFSHLKTLKHYEEN